MPEADSPDAILLRAIESARTARASRERWLRTARQNQLTPDGSWDTWLLLAGRGFGKTRSGAEDLAEYARHNPCSYLAVVAPTFAAGRDVCFEGESGLLNVIEPGLLKSWNRSQGQMVLNNEARITLYSAEEPENLRGPQFHRAWGDELAAWSNLTKAWDNLQFGLRLGAEPQVVVTTTPRPLPLIRELVASPRTVVTRGSTYDNADHLATAALAKFRAKYEGTRLGRQELAGEILEDVAGALWTRAMLEEARPAGPLPAFRRVVVAVDPSGSDGTSGDAQGIVVAAEGADGRGYVLADETVTASPEEWARRVAFLYHKHEADRVVAEKNYGGAMVEAVLRAAEPNLPVTLVTASRGKAVRAEPIAALYEQKRITHAEPFPELEDEMILMTGAGFAGSGSPNRLDAMVWAFTELVLGDHGGGAGWVQFALDEARAIGAAEANAAAPVADAVLMEMPAGTTAVQISGDGPTYTPGPDRRFFAAPEDVQRLQGAGCRLAERTPA